MKKSHRYEKEKNTIIGNLVGGLKEYASKSTVHGISYVFDESLSIFERFIWLVIVCGLGCEAIFLVYKSYNAWQDNPVITTLKTVAKPVSTLAFPAVTICGTGQHMDMVEKVLLHNFDVWNQTRGNDNDDGDGAAASVEDLFSMYMEEVFQISQTNMTILDILSTMISPEASGTNAVRQNEIACSNQAKAKQLRRQISGTGCFPKLPKKSDEWYNREIDPVGKLGQC